MMLFCSSGPSQGGAHASDFQSPDPAIDFDQAGTESGNREIDLIKRLILLAPFALAACNAGGPTVTATNATSDEVAAKVEAAGGSDAFVSPGQWEGTMTINDVQIPGVPPEMAAQMKARMGGQPHSFSSCLTPEEAKQPKGKFFGSDSGQCRYDRFTMAGGSIDAVMKCAEDGVERTMTMTGNYSPNGYKMTVASTGGEAKGNPMAAMSMSMTIDAKRTGECTGKAAD